MNRRIITTLCLMAVAIGMMASNDVILSCLKLF